MAQAGLKHFKTRMMVIGGSAGSLDVILSFLPHLKSDLAFPLVIIMHRKTDSESMLAQLLTSRSSLPVKEVEDKEAILPGVIYLAPSDYHVLVENNGTFSLDVSEKVHYSRPSIDVTFESAADIFPGQVVGLLLSGANHDGTEGLRCIKESNGLAWVQAPSSAEVSFMPEYAMQHVQVDSVLEIPQIAPYINHLA